MKKQILLSIILLLLCFTFNKVAAQSDLAEAKKAIAASNSIYFQSYVKNDSFIFINRYAEDCLIMMPNAPAMKGHKGALDFFKMTSHKKEGLWNGKFITTNVYGLGNGYVTEEGIWQSFDKNNKMIDNGKFLVLWKKTAKGWKMFRDSFSSDNNPMAPGKL